GLLAMRAVYAGSIAYFFYPWNLFLALIPVYFSGLLLKQKTLNYKSILLLGLWLLFLPNAPYLVTDIFHFEARPPVPLWFDLMLVVSGAWNGILLCMISLFRVEKFLNTRCKTKYTEAIIFLLLIFCGYGIYIGRYLRYNSWDVVTDPVNILRSSSHHIYHPFQNLNVWVFTFVFAFFLAIIFFTIKKLPRVLFTPKQF
ncbi:MAG: DUF1361 domain-containing protein, partial [Parafilimonas sp.]